MLNLINNKLEESDTEGKIACVSLNAWQFEGYEDAKIALMESLLKALNENRTFTDKVGDKIKQLIKRIDFIKLGKNAVKKGLPYALGILTGNPLPIALNLSATLENSESVVEKISKFKENYIKPPEDDSEIENIRKFREEFQQMLEDVSSIDNLTVIIDDLDRCTPDRIIDTLEAIKLFLSVKKTTFIIITCLLFSLAAFFVTKFFIEKKYTSKLSLYVDTTETDDSKINPQYSLNMQTYAQRLVATYIRMLDTTSFYTAVSESLDEKYSPAELSSMISFKSDENTEIFDVYVTTTSPTESKLIGDAVGEVAPATIASLRSNANLKVCDPAQIPTGPSSPNTVRNVLIAFAVALVLSLAVSFIRYFADKKIKYDDEMSEILGIPILATIPNFDDYVNKKNKA